MNRMWTRVRTCQRNRESARDYESVACSVRVSLVLRGGARVKGRVEIGRTYRMEGLERTLHLNASGRHIQ